MMTMLSDMAGRTSKGIKYPQEGDLWKEVCPGNSGARRQGKTYHYSVSESNIALIITLSIRHIGPWGKACCFVHCWVFST